MTPSECVPTASHCVLDAVRSSASVRPSPLRGDAHGTQCAELTRVRPTLLVVPRPVDWLASWLEQDDRRRVETMRAALQRRADSTHRAHGATP
jgi:hypothetical protein